MIVIIDKLDTLNEHELQRRIRNRLALGFRYVDSKTINGFFGRTKGVFLIFQRHEDGRPYDYKRVTNDRPDEV